MHIKEYIRKIFWCCPFSLFTYFFYFRKAKAGARIYEHIIKKGPNNVRLFVCPYKGTGDVYLAAALFNNYLLDEPNQSYAFVVVGGGNKKVAELFGIKNIVVLTQNKMDLLIRFLIFVGSKNFDTVILHPDPPCMHTGIADRLRNYNCINFMDMFSKGLYGDCDIKIAVPRFEILGNQMVDYFKEKKLKPGKTVLLSPYSYTLDGIPIWVWNKLAFELSAMGYTVCTNCGSKNEKELKNTIHVELPYKNLKAFLEYGGYFIGIRSGLCEIISTINCKKIFIYQPYLFWGEGNNFSYFNFKDMGLCNDAIELEYEGIEFLQLIEKIKSSIC